MRARRVLIGGLSVLLLAALGLEVGARVLDRTRDQPFDALQRRGEIQTIVNALSGVVPIPGGVQDERLALESPGTDILHPYVGWEQFDNQKLLAEHLEQYRAEDAASVYKVLVLGGSVAAIFHALGEGPLAEVLRADPRIAGREVRVYGYARAGFKQPQSASFLAYLLAFGHTPDAVVLLDGFNEAALSWSNGKNGVHPLHPYLPLWGNATRGLRPDWEMIELLHAVRTSRERGAAFGERILAWNLWRSAFLSRLGLLRLEAHRSGFATEYTRFFEHVRSRPADAELVGPAFDKSDEGLERAIVECWEQSSRSMHGMCAERGIPYLHVLQPTLRDEGSKPATASELSKAGAPEDWIEGVVKLYPRLREAGVRLSAAGVPFLDATGVFRAHPEDLYSDVCHFGARGNTILAEAIGRAFLDLSLPRR